MKTLMNPKEILKLSNAEKGSCLYCEYGVLVPQEDNEIIDFAKCQAFMGKTRRSIFNFNLYEGYEGYLPENGSILSATERPCKKEGGLFKKAERFGEDYELIFSK